LFRQSSLENRPVKRFQRIRDGIQDGVTDLFNPSEMGAPIVFCKRVPGFVAVRESQVIVQHIYDRPILFKACYLGFTARNGTKLGFHGKNFLLIKMLRCKM
jgi:hypothetical protein